MRIWMDGSLKGEQRTVSVRLTGVDAEFMHLIDSLDAGTAQAQELARKLSQHTGIIAVEPDTTHIARALRAYADLIEGKV